MTIPQEKNSTSTIAPAVVTKKKRGIKKVTDITGQRFGRLTVVSLLGHKFNEPVLWRCACACGKSAVVSGPDLKSAHTTSCGCYRLEQTILRSTRHGQARRCGFSGAYVSWAGMIDRCTRPKAEFWHLYGGRGIKVCEVWMNFENFFAYMGDRPEGLSLDRIEVNGNYEPGNTRWANASTQARNQRIRSTNKTGIKGVYVIDAKRCGASIFVNGKSIFLGVFPLTPDGLDRAKAARLLAEDVYWGDNK